MNTADFNTENFIFDSTKYLLEPINSAPYFKATLVNNEYLIYEGVIGNRYNFYRVSIKSVAGEAYSLFYKKYNIDNAHRFSISDDIKRVHELCKNQATETQNGEIAYLKYWNDYLIDSDKKIFNFYGIPFFEPLKEWYNLKLEDHIEQHEHLYANDEVKDSNILQWQKMALNSVGTYLKNSEKRIEYNLSIISCHHALELNKFYVWIKNIVEPALVEDESDNENLKIEQTTKLYYLLELYYEKNCINLTQSQVANLANTKGITANKLNDKWIALKKDEYRHTGNSNNIREFIKCYKLLLEKFEHINVAAFANVKNHYYQLKETYPDKTY